MTKQEFTSKLDEVRSMGYPTTGHYMDALVFWHEQYIASLESENARLEKLFACTYETLAELIVCPHEVYGFKSTKHNCNECDSVNAETCFCWKDWIEAKIAKEATDDTQTL